MRNDLPSLNPGKAMAQAAHAANQFISEWGHTKMAKEWKSEGGHFGTTIVLSADKKIIDTVLKKAAIRNGDVASGPVYDPEYPFYTTTEIAALIPKSKLSAPPIVKDDNKVILFRNELTCAYVLVANGSSNQKDLVGELSLHP